MKNQKQLQTIKNIDESKNNNDLKNILINGNIIELNHIQNRKIFPRRSPKKYKNKSINKKNKEQKLLKDAFNKWKQKSTFLPIRNVLQQIKKNKELNNNLDNLNEDDNDNKKDKDDKYEDKNGNDDKNDKDNKNGKDGIKDKDELFEKYKKK